MPTAIITTPMGVTENRWKVGMGSTPSGSAPFAFRIRSFSRMSGLDPTMVMVPPRIAQNPIGISRRESGMPVRVEIRLTTGRNRAAAPMFCMKLEMAPTVPEMMGMIRFSVPPPMRRM